MDNEVLDASPYDVILEFVRNEQFAHIWRRVNKETVTWDMFCAEPMPRGLSAKETYTIVTALRRQCACELPFDNYIRGVKEPSNWFSVTEAMQAQLRDIVARSQDGSYLDEYLKTHVNSHSQVGLILEEFLSLARRDGFDFTYEEVRSLWRRERLPKTAEEQLIANFQNLIIDTDQHVRRKISYDLIEELHDQLMGGVHLETPPIPRPRIAERKISILDNPDNAIEMACRLANGRGASSEIHPIFREMLIAGIFWEFYPLSTGSALLELIIRKIYYAREGLAVLAYAPFSKISEQWEQGRLIAPKVLCNYLHSAPDCGAGFDATSHFATELQLLSYELDRLHVTLTNLHNDEKMHREVLDHVDYLNRRQRDVLIVALRNPERDFTIDEHRKLYNIAYATARQDFIDLAAHGFMGQYKNGRAFVYRATPLLSSFFAEQEAGHGKRKREAD